MTQLSGTASARSASPLSAKTKTSWTQLFKRDSFAGCQRSQTKSRVSGTVPNRCPPATSCHPIAIRLFGRMQHVIPSASTPTLRQSAVGWGQSP